MRPTFYGTAVYGDIEAIYEGARLVIVENNDTLDGLGFSSNFGDLQALLDDDIVSDSLGRLFLQSNLSITEVDDVLDASARLFLQASLIEVSDDDTFDGFARLFIQSTFTQTMEDDTILARVHTYPYRQRQNLSSGSLFATSTGSYTKPYQETTGSNSDPDEPYIEQHEVLNG